MYYDASVILNNRRMAELLPIQRKTLFNQPNESIMFVSALEILHFHTSDLFE